MRSCDAQKKRGFGSREDRIPRAHAYKRTPPSTDGSYAARPAAPSRYAARNRSKSIASTAPMTVHTK